MHLEPGSRLGAYEVVAPIASGGMGEVYRAHDQRVGRDVAIKVLPLRMSKDAEARARFEREAKAIAAISHPNILALYEFESDDEVAYVVTELLEGETLRARLSRGPLAPQRAVEICVAIADGLAAAHAKGIIHRDLKPENVFVSNDGHVKILDFGLAKVRQAPTSNIDDIATERLSPDDVESDSHVIGTVGYMSPEQIRCEPATAASDIFALGCILYESLSGLSPFRERTPIETMTAVLRDDPTPLSETGKPVAASLERIVRRCLEKHPDMRFQSARDLAFALRASLSTSMAPVSPSSIARRHLRNAAIGAIVVALIAVAGFVIVARKRQRVDDHGPIRSLAVLPFVNATSDRANEYLSDGLSESLINNLSQIPGLVVVSHASSLRYKAQDVAPQSIARDLNVQALLTGRITKPGNDLVISTELIGGRDNRHLWGEQYRAGMADLANVQSAIARQIADQLQLHLSGPTRDTVGKQSTQNGDAYRFYLQGRYEWNKRTGEAFVRAIHAFQRAIDADPSYALAYAGLADSYTLQSIYGEASPMTALPLARAAAEKALSIDEHLAEAHTSLAYVRMNFETDLSAAQREFERAIELNPNYATAHQWYSRCLIIMGRNDDAVREARRAEAVDPLSLVIISETGGVYSDSGRFDEAIAECRRALDLEPKFALAHYILAGVFLKQKRYDDAITEAQKAFTYGGDPRSLVRLGASYAAAGRPRDAAATLDRLELLAREHFVPAYGVAALSATVGKKDEAFAALKRAATEIPPGQYKRLIAQDSLLDPLRSDPRFEAP